MKDQNDFDLFLFCLRRWVMESTGDGPNSTSAWFRCQIYELFPAFPLWLKTYGQDLPDLPGAEPRRHQLRLVR